MQAAACDGPPQPEGGDQAADDHDNGPVRRSRRALRNAYGPRDGFAAPESPRSQGLPPASRAGFDLERFIAGQLVWDRVMAAGVAEAASQGVLVAGLMGGMHLAYGHGVPHQLADLGVTDVRVLLPWDGDGDCSEPPRDIAHAVFGIAPGGRHEPAPPVLLGVLLESHEDGVRIVDVQSGSVGERSGLRADDVVSHAAGQRLRATDDLVAVVRRQAPGTILPLSVRRENREIELLARFPAHSD